MDKQKRWWDWPSAIFIVILVLMVAWRLRATDWAPHLGMMDALAFFGVVLGLTLGVSRFSPRTVRWFGIAYSTFFIVWQLGLSVGKDMQWAERLAQVIGHLWADLYLFAKNIPVTDPLLFLTSMAILIWLLALFGGYRLARYGKPWWPLLVLTLVLIVVDYYHPFFKARDRFSGFFFLVALLLIARQFFLHTREKWVENNVLVDAEAGLDLGKGALILGVVLILIAWNIPVLVQVMTVGTPIQQRLDQSWTKLRDRLSNAVAGLTSPVLIVSDSYGDSIDLGRGAAQGDQIVFTVEPPEGPKPGGVRYYWRTRSYDFYTGSGWKESVDERVMNPANDWQVKSPPYPNRVSMTFTFNIAEPAIRSIFSPGAPINFNHQVQAVVAPAGEGEMDLLATIAEPVLKAGTSYKVQALIPIPTVYMLRVSGANYPEWVSNRYLDLPDHFSKRINDLAMQITAGMDNPYDKAVAITRYLRRNIKYSEKIENPPAGVDLMEWFLFDYKEGFCNYYATAEVLMLRAVGVPARISVGYAEGAINNDLGILTVRRKDSHAWPEVFFNGFGWIEFEPTVSQPERILPEDRVPSSNEPIEPDRPSNLEPNSRNPEQRAEDLLNQEEQARAAINSKSQGWVVTAVICILLGALLGSYTWLRYNPRGMQLPIPVQLETYLRKRGKKIPRWLTQITSRVELSSIEKAFQWVNRLMGWIGKPPKTGMTPSERMELLIREIPVIEVPAKTFLQEYLRAEYGPYMANTAKARQAVFEMWRLTINYRIKQILGLI